MRVRFVSLILCLVVATPLVACNKGEPSAPDWLFFPTVERLDAYPGALLNSRLEERSGCLMAGGKDGKAGLVLLWPDGYTARAVEDGPIQVLDENGTVVGYVGRGWSWVAASLVPVTTPKPSSRPQRVAVITTGSWHRRSDDPRVLLVNEDGFRDLLQLTRPRRGTSSVPS